MSPIQLYLDYARIPKPSSDHVLVEAIHVGGQQSKSLQ